jgi:hypothetical protein
MISGPIDLLRSRGRPGWAGSDSLLVAHLVKSISAALAECTFSLPAAVPAACHSQDDCIDVQPSKDDTNATKDGSTENW